MGFWNKIFGKSDAQKVGGMEDFMTLIRVYFRISRLRWQLIWA